MTAALFDRITRRPGWGEILLLLGLSGVGLRAGEITLAEAIQQTLAEQPGVQIQWESVRAVEGGLQAVQGQFDATVVGGVNVDRRDLPVPPYTGPVSPTPQDEDSASLGVSKRFRNGVVVTPQISVVDVRNITTQSRPVATSDVAVAVTVPLGRGSGRVSAGAQEQAAALSVQVGREAARFAVESRVFATVSAYWQTVGAAETQTLLRETLDRGRELVGLLNSLQEAGLLERASAEQAAAELADYERQLSSASAVAQVARFNLGSALGQRPADLIADAPTPVDALPVVTPPTDASLGPRLAAAALTGRGDHRAVLAAVEREQVLLRKAERDLRPQVDLIARVGYAGGAADNGRFSRLGGALSENTEGPNAGIGVSLAWPMRNHTAQGLLRQQRAAARTAELQAELSAQTVTVAVLNTWEFLQSAAREYGLAVDTVERLLFAATRERERAQSGEASVADVIELEQRLLSARLAAIATRQNYATSLVQLRLLAGLLSVPGEAEQATFNLAQIKQLPVPAP